MLNVKDASGAVTPMKTTQVGGEHASHVIVYQSALPSGAATETTSLSVLGQLELMPKLTDTISVTVAGNTGGLATQATLANLLTAAGDILTQLSGQAALTDVQPVRLATDSVGLATSAKQDTLQASVSTLSPAGVSLYQSTDITDTSDVTAAAAAPGVARVPLVLTVGNSHATVGTWVDVKDGSSVIFSVYAPALSRSEQYDIAGRGAITCTANTALNVACVTTGTNVRFSLSYRSV